MTQAKFQSTSIYPMARAASMVSASKADEITNKFQEYINEHITADQKRSVLSRKLFGSVSTEDFGAALKNLPPIKDPAFSSSGMGFVDAWHQFKAFYNDEVEAYNKFAAIATAIQQGHALEIIMDVDDFIELQSYAEQFVEEE